MFPLLPNKFHNSDLNPHKKENQASHPLKFIQLPKCLILQKLQTYNDPFIHAPKNQKITSFFPHEYAQIKRVECGKSNMYTNVRMLTKYYILG